MGGDRMRRNPSHVEQDSSRWRILYDRKVNPYTITRSAILVCSSSLLYQCACCELTFNFQLFWYDRNDWFRLM